jgi:hypothetical protein
LRLVPATAGGQIDRFRARNIELAQERDLGVTVAKLCGCDFHRHPLRVTIW